MLRALDETVITGVPTTAGYHKLILDHPSFRAGDVDTGFIVKHGAGEAPCRAALSLAAPWAQAARSAALPPPCPSRHVALGWSGVNAAPGAPEKESLVLGDLCCARACVQTSRCPLPSPRCAST